MHARSTAAQAVKNNLRTTELKADKSLILAQQKVCTLKRFGIHVIISTMMDFALHGPLDLLESVKFFRF